MLDINCNQPMKSTMGLFHCVILMVLFYCVPASADRCVYHHIVGNDTYVSCDTGCCYSYVYPCCIEPFYDTVTFKVSISLSCAGLAISCLLIVLRYRYRRDAIRRSTQRQNHPNVPAQGSTVYGNTMPFQGYDNFAAAYPTPDSQGIGTPTFPPSQFAAPPPAYSTLPPAYKECEDPHNKGNNQ